MLFRVFAFACFALIAAIAPLSVAAQTDLSEYGSHEAMIEAVGSAQKSLFFETVASYDEQIAAAPDDAVLATEKCRFIGYFLYSEDFYIEEAETLHEESEAALARFDNEPAVELYRFDQLWGEEEIEKGTTILADPALTFTTEQRAGIHLALAAQYRNSEQLDLAREQALRAHEARPTPASQLELARSSPDEAVTDEMIALLEEELPDENSFQKRQRMNLLSDLGAEASALELLRELSSEEEFYLGKMESARIFASAGEIEPARRDFLAALDEEWNRSAHALEYFEFEKSHGDAESALASYHRYRDEGLTSDPFLYYRIGLFQKYPDLPWQPRDLLGLLCIAAAIAVFSLLPLLVILPVHYWGLIRFKKGKPSLPVTPAWTLWHAWGSFTFFILVGLILGFVFAYEFFFALLFGDETTVETVPADLARVVLYSSALSLLGIGFVVGFKKLVASFRPSRWSVGRAIGFALAAYIGLRFVGAINSSFVTAFSEITPSLDASTITEEGIGAILDLYGPLLLILSVAVITPLIEEIVFRGAMLTGFMRHIPFWWANVLQASLFMLVHENVAMFPFLFTLGLVCGFLRQRSGSLIAPTLVHAINNGVVALVLIAMR